jgi:predicted nucleic acid-binding protein
MVLVDTSVWIRFLAGKAPFAAGLDGLLEREEVMSHELVYGELMIGDRSGRAALLASYEHVPPAPIVAHVEVVELVRARKLQGRGIGWVGAHLLASTLVARASLWTADASLAAVAERLGLSYALD